MVLKVSGQLHLRLPGLTAVKAAIRRPQGALKKAIDEAGKIYTTFVLRDFDKKSRGNGKWRKLKPKTIERKRSSAILVNKRVLRIGLATSIMIRTQTVPRLTIIAYFGGRKRHRDSKMSIARLADIHHLGLGRVPVRRILVTPDKPTLKRMADKILKAALRLMGGK